MKTKLAILALAATSVAANAAYIFSATVDESTTQPSGARVYGVEFTLNASAVLNGFAVYDYSGNEGAGWTAANAKTVSLYSLSGATYNQIATRTFTTSAGMTSVPNLIGDQDFLASSFTSLGALGAGTYFIGISEVKTNGSQPLFDGYVTPDDTTIVEPTIPQLDGYTIARLGGSPTLTAVPASFASSRVSSFSGVMVIPSLVNVPEAGSSVMALALGAMVVRFRSRRA